MKSVDQELYDELYLLLDREHTVYTKMPPTYAEYPYYYMGVFYNNPKVTKDNYKGVLNATIHVWSRERIDVSNLSEVCLEYAKVIDITDRFKWLLNTGASNYRILEDNSTQDALHHGVVELEFKYIERRF